MITKPELRNLVKYGRKLNVILLLQNNPFDFTHQKYAAQTSKKVR